MKKSCKHEDWKGESALQENGVGKGGAKESETQMEYHYMSLHLYLN